ncbi:FtsH protease activity modulator HflK [Candidatus Thiothrix sp. Deng01]|uniref:Protein HflK n=1 Tax=Candidatus Thiothrix phosphatis TaxID=3112415 RepID=A0ABU6CSZ5_9GAMM|nr:FtsH protease activity modulator HflK [Candidatus Thiothrix sp. Deng01]MEB4589946.1 FtsH protease activity modulator HflK [Candidatus Thiothrix sp. Deng01]
MPWNEPGGNQQDPWTGKKRTPGGNDPEELIRKLNQKLSKLFGGSGHGDGSDNNGGKGVLLLVGLLVIGWLLSGFYTIDARQKGLVLRFGAYQETTGAGLHWRLPYPFETVEVFDVEQNRSAQDRSTMLTKDENIVDIAVSVQYKISNAEEYAFNILNADYVSDQTQGTLYQVMRGSIRDIIGRNNMDFILQEGREQIAIDTQNLMQQILNDYKAGLKIIKVNLTYAEAPTEVKDAFDEANRAREDKNRFQNEAETYSKKVLPEAGGQAARLKADAEAFRQEAVDRAMGDAARFSQLVVEYHKAPAVTRERLYLDAMESVMSGSRKVMVDTRSNNMLYLPLDQLNTQGNAATAAATAAAAQNAQQDATTNVNSPAAASNNGAANVRQQSRETSVREGR